MRPMHTAIIVIAICLLLKRTWAQPLGPVVIFMDTDDEEGDTDDLPEHVEQSLNTSLMEPEDYVENLEKRGTRWGHKRQGKLGSSPDPIPVCEPSREELFKLLLAIHDARLGNIHKTVRICNRNRPASRIFTSLRFLGRKR